MKSASVWWADHVARLMETRNKGRILENVCIEYQTKKENITNIGILGDRLWGLDVNRTSSELCLLVSLCIMLNTRFCYHRICWSVSWLVVKMLKSHISQFILVNIHTERKGVIIFKPSKWTLTIIYMEYTVFPFFSSLNIVPRSLSNSQ